MRLVTTWALSRTFKASKKSCKALKLLHWLPFSPQSPWNPTPRVAIVLAAIKHFYHFILINTPFRNRVANKSLPVFNRCNSTEFSSESSRKWNRQQGSTVRHCRESVFGCLPSRKLRRCITVISLLMSEIIFLPQNRMINDCPWIIVLVLCRLHHA